MMQSNAIVPFDVDNAVEGVKFLAAVVRELREKVFVKDQDYGIIPGTGTKPVLLLPGMEKLMRALRLRPVYMPVAEVQDFDKPLFYFRYECQLIEIDTGLVVSSANGSANSMESKWRYRNASRVCPACGKETIIKGKAEYGGGWLCFAKKGGCGAKYKEGDAEIEGQNVGRTLNEDIFDQINTIDKIAQKRALASAIKGAANVSEFFTVDLEDLPSIVMTKPLPPDAIEGDFVEEAPQEAQKTAPATAQGQQQPAKPPIDTDKAREQLSNGGERRVTTTAHEAPDDDDLRNKATAEAFIAGTRKAGIEDNDVLKALGVDKLSQWPAGRRAAGERVKTWLNVEAAYKATARHFSHRHHFDALVAQLYPDGVVGLPGDELIAAIDADRAAQHKDGKHWENDKTLVSTLSADVWSEFAVTLADALAKLNMTLPDFSSPNAVKDAIRTQLQFEAIRQ